MQLVQLPPVGEYQEKLERELALVPRRHKEEAVQEAWVAHLEGRNVIRAVGTFRKREVRHEKGWAAPETGEDIGAHTPASQLDKEDLSQKDLDKLADAGLM